MTMAKTIKTDDISQDDKIIAVMGPTGCGKSNFIDCLTGTTKLSGTTLKSVTQDIQAIRIKNRFMPNQNIVLVDTPGFDDTTRSDSAILGMIAEWMKATYEKDVMLSGILYLHRITDNRMGGTPLRNLQVFGRLCGDEPARKVTFVTTMWDKIEHVVGERRQTELEEFLRPMVDRGALLTSFDNQSTSAWRIANLAVTETTPNLPMLLQEELVNLKRPLNETQAGRKIYDNTKKILVQYKENIQMIERDAKNKDDAKVLAALEEERTRLLAELNVIFEESEKLKIPLKRRILVFFSRRPKAKSVNFRG